MFESSKIKSAASRLIEEQLYERVYLEITNGQKRNGLWAKALANSDGNEEKAKSLYIQYRVQSIKDEIEVSEVIEKENTEILKVNNEAKIKAKAKFEKEYHHSIQYKNYTINHNLLTYWVNDISFKSAKDAKKFIDNQA